MSSVYPNSGQCVQKRCYKSFEKTPFYYQKSCISKCVAPKPPPLNIILSCADLQTAVETLMTNENGELSVAKLFSTIDIINPVASGINFTCIEIDQIRYIQILQLGPDLIVRYLVNRDFTITLDPNTPDQPSDLLIGPDAQVQIIFENDSVQTNCSVNFPFFALGFFEVVA